MSNESKTVAEVIASFMQKESYNSLDGMGKVDFLDIMRNIVNNKFSKEEIHKALNHPNYKIRKLAEEFIREFLPKEMKHITLFQLHVYFNAENDKKTNSSNCFIATAVYNSPIAREVRILCTFRDTVLRNYFLGRSFIKTYESFSPPLAQWIAKRPRARQITRLILIHPTIILVKNFLIAANSPIIKKSNNICSNVHRFGKICGKTFKQNFFE